MNTSHNTSTFLLQFFQEFYREVLIQREIAHKTANAPHPRKKKAEDSKEEKGDQKDQESQGEDSQEVVEDQKVKKEPEEPQKESPFDGHDHDENYAEDEELCDRIQRVFRTMFERFALAAHNQSGEFAEAHFQEALYAMVSLLDEVFLSFTWDAKDRWEDNLMEKQIFHTQIAGELLFRKVEDLIHANDPIRRDIAIIYLMVLGLGFKGKYRGEDDEGRLQWYRKQLYILANYKPVALYTPGRPHLIEESYDHIISLPPTKILPNVRNWILAFVAVVLVYLMVSSVLWFKLVKDMDNSIGQILTQAQKLGLS